MINQELNLVNSWLTANKIAINSDKTKFILFSYRKSLNFTPLIRIGNSIIRSSNKIKFLGIFVDNNLKFNFHSNYISTKISKSIGILSKLKNYLPSEILKIIYYALVHPYFHYSIEAWYSTFSNSTKKLDLLQKRACRYIHNLSYYDHTLNYFKNSCILKLNELHELQIAVFVYKNLNLCTNPTSNSDPIFKPCTHENEQQTMQMYQPINHTPV